MKTRQKISIIAVLVIILTLCCSLKFVFMPPVNAETAIDINAYTMRLMRSTLRWQQVKVY